jgi:HlyD family secretion protein
VRVKTLIVIGVIVLVVLGLAGGGYYLYRTNAAALLSKATTVWVEQIQPSELSEIVSASGTIEPKTKVSISARVTARIEELPFKEGDTVTRGKPGADPPVPASVLLRLDATDLQAALRAAQARRSAIEAQIAVSQAQITSRQERLRGTAASLEEARKNLKRQKELLASQDVSQSSVDTAQMRVEELEAAVAAEKHGLTADELGLKVLSYNMDSADADIARAKDSLSFTTITSPLDGTVTRVNAEVGELVVTGTMNNPGTVILEVADLSQMLVVAEVEETEIGKVLIGQAAKVRVQGYEDQLFDGVAESVALVPSLSRDGSKHYKVKVLLRTDSRICSGLSAYVNILTRSHREILKVPSQAVLGRHLDDLPREMRDSPHVDKSKTRTAVVYRVDKNKAVVTPVKTGPSNTTHTIILGGLSEGDKVITGPYKVLEKLGNDQNVQEEKATSQPASQPTTRPTTRPSTGTATQAATEPIKPKD